MSIADADAVDADQEQDAQVAERVGAIAFLGCLKRRGVLCAEPPPPPPLTIGTAVLAVLDEDSEWHEATVIEKLPGGDGPPRFLVRFVEWPKMQETARASVVSLASVADDDDVDTSEGECELCSRCLQLTFHHLIPKETHGRYLGKSLPTGVAAAAAARGLDPQPSREFLHRHGCMLCRFCHTAVHRMAPNAVLAERFNTLDALAASSEIARFVAFAARQKKTAH